MSISDHIHRMVTVARRHGYNNRTLAMACGRQPGAFRSVGQGVNFEVGAGGFNPTVETIKNMEMFVAALDPSALEDSASASPLGSDLSSVASGATLRGDKIKSARVALPGALAPFACPFLWNVERYLDGIKSREGALYLDSVDPRVLRALAPGAVCHVADVPDPVEDAKWLIWQSRPDFRGGVDYTGRSISAGGDAAFHAELVEDLVAAVAVDFALYHALHRETAWDEAGGRFVIRNLARLTRRVETGEEGPKVLWITMPQARGAIPDLFSDLAAA